MAPKATRLGEHPWENNGALATLFLRRDHMTSVRPSNRTPGRSELAKSQTLGTPETKGTADRVYKVRTTRHEIDGSVLEV